jgi:hypothetical protein
MLFHPVTRANLSGSSMTNPSAAPNAEGPEPSVVGTILPTDSEMDCESAPGLSVASAISVTGARSAGAGSEVKVTMTLLMPLRPGEPRVGASNSRSLVCSPISFAINFLKSWWLFHASSTKSGVQLQKPERKETGSHTDRRRHRGETLPVRDRGKGCSGSVWLSLSHRAQTNARLDERCDTFPTHGVREAGFGHSAGVFEVFFARRPRNNLVGFICHDQKTCWFLLFRTISVVLITNERELGDGSV